MVFKKIFFYFWLVRSEEVQCYWTVKKVERCTCWKIRSLSHPYESSVIFSSVGVINKKGLWRKTRFQPTRKKNRSLASCLNGKITSVRLAYDPFGIYPHLSFFFLVCNNYERKASSWCIPNCPRISWKMIVFRGFDMVFF